MEWVVPVNFLACGPTNAEIQGAAAAAGVGVVVAAARIGTQRPLRANNANAVRGFFIFDEQRPKHAHTLKKKPSTDVLCS